MPSFFYSGTAPDSPMYRPEDCEVVVIPSNTAGWNLEGWLFVPDGHTSAKLPLLVCGHGTASRKDQGLHVMARDMVRLGQFAALAVDYRQFGGSDGAPRNVIDPVLHAEDLVTTLKFCRSELGHRFDVGRLGLLGCSLGGAVAVAAALQAEQAGIDLSVVVSYVGSLLPNPELTPKQENSFIDACSTLDSLQPGSIYMHAAIPPESIGTASERFCFLPDCAQAALMAPPHYDVVGMKFPARGFAQLRAGLAKLKPWRAILQVKSPIVHIHGVHDQLCAPVEKFRDVGRRRPNFVVLEYDCDHFSPYPLLRPALLEKLRPWMGDDPSRTYKPDIYEVCIRDTAETIKRMFETARSSKL